MSGVLEAMPAALWNFRWVGAAVPTEAGVDAAVLQGNCQTFAYAVLATQGFRMAPMRSDELWHDEEWTTSVQAPQPLDLVLFNTAREPFAAHVGLVAGSDAVLHLNKEVGRPVVWRWADFSMRPRYRVVLGYKRPYRLS